MAKVHQNLVSIFSESIFPHSKPFMPNKNTTNQKRRKLLKFLGLGGILVAGKSASAQIRVREIANPNIRVATTGANYITVKLLRPEDLLSLELRYYNFNLSGNTLQKNGDPAYLVVIFQPQSMLEQAWKETSTGPEAPTVPGRMIIGGESRLVFQIPSSITSIKLITNELLAWEKYDLVVNSRAKATPIIRRLNGTLQGNLEKKVSIIGRNQTLPIKKVLTKDEKIFLRNQVIVAADAGNRNIVNRIAGGITEISNDPVGPPGEMETSLEVPVRLYLSPTKNAGWNHRSDLKIDKGILKQTNKLFELWHTRLVTKNTSPIKENELTNEDRVLRALWADDAKKIYNDPITEEFIDKQVLLTSMTNNDRHQIVHESSDFVIPKFYPQPVKAYKLFLTTLGAWLDSTMVVERKSLENAGIQNQLNVLKWRHIETMGREHYVEVVKAGNILPFGHEAVLIKITERKPHSSGTAANFQRELVVITEPIKEYNYKDSKGTFMNFSFASVEMITTTSPLLDNPKKPVISTGGPSSNYQFIITAGGKEVPFKIKGTDLEGNPVDFSMPISFVSTEILGNADTINQLVDIYQKGIFVNHSTNFNGQKFSLAPKDENCVDTSFSTKNVAFGMMAYSSPDELQGFLPTIGNAEIIEPSYQRLTGNAKAVSVSLVDALEGNTNKGQVFAKFEFSQPVNFAGNTDKTGGLALPNFNLSGLSRATGAFGGDIAQYKSGLPSASSFFNVNAMPDPTLFGVFKLSEILKFVNSASNFDMNQPLESRLNNSGIPNLSTTETPDAFITSYVIKPEIQAKTIGSFVRFKPNTANGFIINTRIKSWKDKSKTPDFNTTSSLDNFEVGVVQVGSDYLINVKFQQIKFEVTAGKKPDVSVLMDKNNGIRFGGPLSFINALNSLIPMDGFSDPPYLDVSLTGVKCGYTQTLPNLQFGAFTLSNISLGAEVNLPFTGGPLTMGFRFCERQQPFTLTISCLGGGGFFGMEVDLQGIRQIEAAIEFGAAASVNFGVASGAVSIMAGIYFKMVFESGQNSTQLTGYVRINGAVSVLGLITASIELYMALTYLIDKNKAYGEASLKIKVEVLFFSKTVTIHTQRTFAGSGNDPNFQTAITQKEWETYCGAFAA